MEKRFALAGLLGVALSSGTIVVMAQLRTDGYDHLHKAVSELGSLDAPNKWLFNVLGYLIPGLLISYFAVGLGRSWGGRHRFFVGTLLLSGVFLLLAGAFPMDMTQRSSPGSLIHTMGSLGSGVAWLLCSLGSWGVLRQEPGWQDLAGVSVALPLLVVLAILFTPADTPGLGQRFAFMGYFLFVGLLSWRLLTITNRSSEFRKVA